MEHPAGGDGGVSVPSDPVARKKSFARGWRSPIENSTAYDGTCSSGCNPAPKQASFRSVIDVPVYESNYEEQETVVSLTPSTDVACNDAIAAIQKMEDADRLDAAAPASPSRTDAKPSPVRPGLVRTLSWTRRERARRASSPVVVADTQAEAARLAVPGPLERVSVELDELRKG